MPIPGITSKMQILVWVRTIPSPSSAGAFPSHSDWNPGVPNASPSLGIGGYDITPAISTPYGVKPVLQSISDGTVAANFGAGYDAHWIVNGLGAGFVGLPPAGYYPGWKNDNGQPTTLDPSTQLGSATLLYPNTAGFSTTAGLMTTTGAGKTDGTYYFETVNTAVDIFSVALGSGVGCITPDQNLNYWFSGARNSLQPNAGILLGNSSNAVTTGYLRANNAPLGQVPNPQLDCAQWTVICWAVAIRTTWTAYSDFFPVELPCIPCCNPVCETTILPPI